MSLLTTPPPQKTIILHTLGTNQIMRWLTIIHQVIISCSSTFSLSNKVIFLFFFSWCPATCVGITFTGIFCANAGAPILSRNMIPWCYSVCGFPCQQINLNHCRKLFEYFPCGRCDNFTELIAPTEAHEDRTFQRYKSPERNENVDIPSVLHTQKFCWYL